MSKLEVGQEWYNTQNANQPVTIIQVIEQGILVKTLSGFVYTYDYKQFLEEYSLVKSTR